MCGVSEVCCIFAVVNDKKTHEDMATTTAAKRTTHPMSYYWGVVKDMDDSQKLELVTMLIESVKPKIMAEAPMRRYTMDDINAMLDEAEANIAAGNVIDDEDVWRELEEEFAREDAEEDAHYAACIIEP
jgi:hypothetical protein